MLFLSKDRRDLHNWGHNLQEQVNSHAELNWKIDDLWRLELQHWTENLEKDESIR